MAAIPDETKFSHAIQKGLNCIGLNYAMVVGNYMTRNTEYQLRMMDLIMAFLSRWAADYEADRVTEGERMYVVGEVAHTMLESLQAGKHGRGLHHRY